LDPEGTNVRIVEGAEDLFDLEETSLVLREIDGVAALEIDFDEDETHVVIAENRFQEPASAEDLLQDQVVRRRQVVEVILGGRNLGRMTNKTMKYIFQHTCKSYSLNSFFLTACKSYSNIL
jgi:hypothetical protein